MPLQASSKPECITQLYKAKMPPKGCALLGLIGHPLDKSCSDRIHNAYCQTVGLPAYYGKASVTPNTLADFLEQAKVAGLTGLSVTMPLKEVILDYLDEIDPQAQSIGAVNTVLFKNGKAIGYNTDGIGAIKAIEQKLNQTLSGKRIVIIGAGGAAKAIAAESVKQGAHVTILNRTQAKAKQLATKLNCAYGPLTYLPEVLASGSDILVQATCVGMLRAHSLIPAPLLTSSTLVFDIIIQPAMTELLKNAQQQGCPILSGQAMWIHQALEQYKIWLGDTAVLDETALKSACQAIFNS